MSSGVATGRNGTADLAAGAGDHRDLPASLSQSVSFVIALAPSIEPA
jgi:hypothetical protein